MENNEYIYFNSRDELIRLDINNIVFFEGESNYTHIVTKNNLKSTICMNLCKVQEVLNDKLKKRRVIFARIGKKYIVNMNYIHTINTLQQKLILSDSSSFSFQLNIGKESLKKFKSLFISNF